MPREKIPIELMSELCLRALLRARRRVYMKCFEGRASKVPDPQVAVEECNKVASKVRTFHKSDFEVEARRYIVFKRRYDLKLSSLLRKLRMLASNPEVTWIRYYMGDFGRQRGIYEITDPSLLMKLPSEVIK